METNPAYFSADYDSCRDDVPNVFCNDINRQKIEFSWMVRLARIAGLDPAIVAFPATTDRRFDLYAYEAAAGFDCHVVAAFSPGFGNPEAEFGRFCHELKLSPLAATFAVVHHLPGIHRCNEAPTKNAAGEGRVSFFSDFVFSDSGAISPIPTVIPSEARNPYLANHGGGWEYFASLSWRSRTVRKLVLLLYQCEIGKHAKFATIIFALNARS
jgi:hypothetical protein